MIYQKYYFVFILLLFFNTINATDEKGKLTGTVTDATTQKMLSNVNLYITDLKVGTTTNGQGVYKFNNLPNGTFTIEVSFVGYKSYVGAVIINGNTVANFSLATSVIENEKVTVTGVSSATQLKRLPMQVSIISKKQMDESAGTNLLDAIANQAGISIVTTGPAIAKPFIRGLGYNRVVTINDGIRQEGQQWGDEHGVEVDEYSAQKVEVLRGAASLMYGSDAIGGVVNILTNVPVTNNTIKANLMGSTNSNNNMYGGYANVAGNINGYSWNVYGSVKDAGDYKNKYDGKVLNSRFNEKNFGGSAGINKSWGYSHLLFSNYDQHVGMVEGDRDANGNFILNGYGITNELGNSKTPLIPNQRIRHFKIASDNSFSFNDGSRVTALVGYQRNQRQEFGDVAAPASPTSWFDLKTITYNIAYHLPVWQGWKTSLGIDGMEQQNTNRGQEAIIPNYDLFDFGIYGYSAKTINKTTISGGLRFDTRSLSSRQMLDANDVKFEAYKKQFHNLSASLGFTQELSEKVSVKANVGRGFRAPNVAELSANGEHEGTNRYELGNKNLNSETSFSIDAGIEITTQHISLNIAPFFTRINNYIYYEKIVMQDGTDSLINNTPAFQFAHQSANMRGVDINFDIHPHPLDWLHFENTFSYVRGTFTKPVDGSNNLPLIAPLRLLTELRAEFPHQLKNLKNFYAKLEMDNITKQNNYFTGYNTETATNGYTLFNAGIGSDVVISGRKIFSVNMTFNNITDVAYQSHLNRLKYFAENPVTHRMGVFNMGRNFTAKIIVPLEWKVKNTNN
jgi:iron complex outermembrane recepter protein